MAMLHLTVVVNVINKAILKTMSSRVDLTVLADDENMADTSQQEELPQTNGIDALTEEEKSKMRPADIDADMREMERRKRVEMMMNSRLFREELERIIETQMKDGAGPSGLLQQISEMMGHQGARFNANVFRNSNCVVPINDIRGVESMGYAKGEKLLRCKLASVFRLLDLYGWTQGVGGMITARLNQDQEHFLVNPYGLLYHEVTASSLVKVDMQGNVVEQGTTNFGVHIAGYQLHSTIHAARPDIKCIVHIATPSVTAISSTKCGILPLGQESIVIGDVSNHHYLTGGNLDPEEREKLSRNFGPINKVMLLTNRGALCCGETVEEAFFNVYNTVLACETQLKLMPVGIDNLTLISDETRKAIYEASRKAPVPQQSSVAEPSPLAEKLEKRWRIGGTEFEALMRMLDNAGFRTGYIYRNPLVKSEPPRPRNDVEVPPAVSSLGYLLEEEELYKQGLWKGGRKGTDRTRWLNSPNVYQKVEILETGTPDPKKITKWVSDGSPTHSSTPVKIEGALQFVPKNTNPKEFKQLQQQIKDYRRADKISAGPQSHILEGVTWEEAKKMQDATVTGVGEQVVLVGAASKGIIQRGFQHNAMVYKTPYAKNPFDAVTDQELDQYKKEVERKTRGDPYDESQSESEALSSFNISRATHESSTAKSPIQSPVSVTSETEEESRDEPRVLRIATKQVPAPSQPEVVLSDERSVKLSVVDNPAARREGVKSEHTNVQRGTNKNSVNADFLNEQRRSEMMTRRHANGRGVSGVSRLSSSRSTSFEDWSWTIGLRPQDYEPCYLETARAQEIAKPMKPIITDVNTVVNMKRKLKRRDFFDNYEKRLKSDDATDIENKAEIGEVQLCKNAGIDFPTKVNLAYDNNINKGLTHQSSNTQEEKMHAATIDEMNSNKNIEIQLIDNIMSPEDESSCNKTFKMFSDSELVNLFKKATDFNENTDTPSNEVEYCIINHDDFEDDVFEKNDENENEVSVSEKVSDHKNQNEDLIENNNNQEMPITPEIKSNSEYDVKKQISNFVNEVEFLVRNTLFSPDNSTEMESTSKESTVIDVETVTHQNIVSNDNSKLLNQIINFENNYNEPNSGYNHSTPLDIQDVETNPFEDSLRSFLLNEKNAESAAADPIFDNINSTMYSSEESYEKSNVTVKNGDLPSELTPGNERNDSNDIKNCGSLNYLDVDQDSNFSRSLPNGFDSTFSEIDRDSECLSPISMTGKSDFGDEKVPKHFLRCDSVTEVVSSIKGDIRPSKLVLDFLADTENSVKYNLNTQKMNLIYSITPPNDVGDSKNPSIADDTFDEFENDKDDNLFNTSIDIEKKDDSNVNKTTEFSETSLISNVSNQGSDLLELPNHTYLDLQKSSEENFGKIMSTSVDQLMKELMEAEAIAKAQNLVDEISNDVANLNLSRGNYKSSKLELNNFVQEKIFALNVAKKLAEDLINNLPCYDTENSLKINVCKSEESIPVESIDQSIYVIHEVIHHVVDKDSLNHSEIKHKKTVTDKKVKESMNIELKGLKEDYDLEDEKSMKCSTPITLLTPARTRNNSNCEDQILPDLGRADNENHEPVGINTTSDSKSPQNYETAETCNSSPSTESQNFAEQEVTSESTDNDTKSDNSKEKQTQNGEPLKNQSSSSPDQLNYRVSLDSLDNCTMDQNVESEQFEQNKLSFCVIEYTTDNQSNLEEKINEVDESVNDDSLENNEVTESSSSKEDLDSDVDKSLEDFLHDFNNRQDTIDNMWQNSEKKSENIIAEVRLSEANDIKQEIIHDQFMIDQLIKETESNTSYIINYLEEKSATFTNQSDNSNFGIEEQSTTFIVNDENSDADMEEHPSFIINDDDPVTDSHRQYDKVDDCLKEESRMPLENLVINKYLPAIEEESELEITENMVSQEISAHEISAEMSCESTVPRIPKEESSTEKFEKKLEFIDDKLNNFNNELNFSSEDEQILSSFFDINSVLDLNMNNTLESKPICNNKLLSVTDKLEFNETDVEEIEGNVKCEYKSESDLTVEDNFEEASGDSKTIEFYSCQNSISVHSVDEQEKTTNSTLNVSTEEFEEGDQIYFADVSNVDRSSPRVQKSDSSMSEEINADLKSSDVSENFADISSNISSSPLVKNDAVTLQYMAIRNHATKEFVNLDNVTFLNNTDNMDYSSREFPNDC